MVYYPISLSSFEEKRVYSGMEEMSGNVTTIAMLLSAAYKLVNRAMHAHVAL